MQLTYLAADLIDRQCLASFAESCTDLSDDDVKTASSKAATTISLCLSVPNALSLITTSWLGARSDVVGRKRILMLSVAATMISALGSVAVAWTQATVWLMVPFYLMSGLGGQLGTYNATIFAFIADVCEGSVRARVFSFVESSIFLGASIGPLLGGLLYRLSGATLVYAAGSGLYTLCFVYLLAVFPPGTLAEQQNASEPRNCLKVALGPLKLVYERSLTLLCLLFACQYWAVNNTGTIFAEYGKLDKFNVSAEELGYLSSIKYLSYWLCLMVLLPLLMAKCLPEASAQIIAVRIGTLVAALVLCCYGLASNKTELYVFVALEGAASIAIPSVRAILSLGLPPLLVYTIYTVGSY